jgi:hypothetical protein
MILLDTSVLIRFLRTADTKISRIMATQSCAISPVTRAEILHGAKNEADYVRLVTVLNGFTQLNIDGGSWDRLARNLYQLRLRGILIPFPDAIIATLAINEKIELWTYDNHFALMQPVLPELRLFSEPP